MSFQSPPLPTHHSFLHTKSSALFLVAAFSFLFRIGHVLLHKRDNPCEHKKKKERNEKKKRKKKKKRREKNQNQRKKEIKGFWKVLIGDCAADMQ
jgi:predicted tellurium resistance membrane protein TerC